MKIRRAIVSLATQDLEKSTEFYRLLFQQDAIKEIPKIYTEFQVAGLTLGIYQPKVAIASGMAVSLCLEVESLEAAIAQLTDLGFPPSEIIQSSHGREAFAQDPDGNRIILYQPKIQ
jgi:predicted enzyme related to lactoylglutathione lyase